MDGYLAIVLDNDSQGLLLKRVSPSYPKVYAHHVTVSFRPSVDVYDEFKAHLGEKIELRVCGYAKDERVETVVVETDILKGRLNHITVSTNNVAPFHSKALVEKGYAQMAEPFVLQGTFEFIQH
ncbi:MAG: hypothetical protein WCV82_04035 [Candidatus Paceibacterota bacterium]|jgi:hypothetical protein